MRADLLRVALGGLGVVVGAQLLVSGARTLAAAADLSEGFVGLTLVAVGTSLPELVTGVAAARRGYGDLVVGNVLGSNVANSLGVLTARRVVRVEGALLLVVGWPSCRSRCDRRPVAHRP